MRNTTQTLASYEPNEAVVCFRCRGLLPPGAKACPCGDAPTLETTPSLPSWLEEVAA